MTETNGSTDTAPSEPVATDHFKFWSDHGAPVAWVVLDADKHPVRAAHPFFVEREAMRFAELSDLRSPHDGPHTTTPLYTHPAPRVTEAHSRREFFEVLCPDGEYVGDFGRIEHAEAFTAGRKGFVVMASTYTRTAALSAEASK